VELETGKVLGAGEEVAEVLGIGVEVDKVLGMEVEVEEECPTSWGFSNWMWLFQLLLHLRKGVVIKVEQFRSNLLGSSQMLLFLTFPELYKIPFLRQIRLSIYIME
jgi:hypothetical protein